MAKNDITPATEAKNRLHEQKPGRGYRVSIIRTASAGIYVCHTRSEFFESRTTKTLGLRLSRKIDKIGTARRVLRRIQRRVPDAYLMMCQSLVGDTAYPS